jgi:DNA polymerase-3 subunit gamma/tau
MSYLVLARKSRPQTFSQVVGQRSVVKTLQNSILRDRVAHAILFSGVRGVGKTTIARIMAKAINCRAEAANRPCDACPSCREFATGSSLDLTEIDGASNRGIQEIRELKERIKFLPTSSKYRIIIIDEVHMLTTEAFNALLKTLEEPPAHVYFMFATTEIHKIPVTILSRCQQYELKRISASELSEHFHKLTVAEGYEIDPAALALIVREAAGSVRDGLSLLDQMFSFGEHHIRVEDVVEVLGLVDRELLLRLTTGLLEGDAPAVLAGLGEVFDFGTDIKRFLEDLMSAFRTLMLCKIGGCDNLVELPAEELALYRAMAERYSRETLHQKLSLLMRAAEEIKLSAQPRLALETGFLSIIEADNIIPVSTLLGQVDKILAALPPCPPVNTVDPLIAKIPPPAPPSSSSGERQAAAPPGTTAAPEQPRQQPQAASPAPAKTPAKESTPLVAAVAADSPSGTTPAVENSEDRPLATADTPHRPNSHERDVRRDWQQFIAYVKERSLWMSQDLQRADGHKEVDGELRLNYSDPVNCALLRQKDNRQQLNELAVDFFQKPLKVRFIVPTAEEPSESNGELPSRKRAQLASDPLVLMAVEIFNGEVGDIRIGPSNR